MAERVTVYGADWCGDTIRTKRELDSKGVSYRYVDIDSDAEGEKMVIEFSKGKRRIPLVEIASEGGEPSRMAVPSASDLEKALKE